MYSASRGILYTAPPKPDDEADDQQTDEAVESLSSEQPAGLTADD